MAAITRGGQAAMLSSGHLGPNQQPIHILPHGVTHNRLGNIGTECLRACIIPLLKTLGSALISGPPHMVS